MGTNSYEYEPKAAIKPEPFKLYTRKGSVWLRPYVPGEDLTGISVNKEDDPESDLGWIARNPDNHEDKWYLSREWFNKNYNPDAVD